MSDKPTTDIPPEIVKATPQGKWLAAGLTVFALGLVIFFILYALPLVQSTVAAAPAASTRSTLKLILIYLAALIFLSAGVLIFNGRKILVAGQCPPPDAWVMRDTPVKRGTAAKRIAWAYIAIGIASCLLATALFAHMWLTLNQSATVFELKQALTRLPSATVKTPPAVK